MTMFALINIVLEPCWSQKNVFLKFDALAKCLRHIVRMSYFNVGQVSNTKTSVWHVSYGCQYQTRHWRAMSMLHRAFAIR